MTTTRAPDPHSRTPAEPDEGERFHYDLETRLADRLRRASADERPRLYGEIYDELYRELEARGLEHRVAQNDPGQTELLLVLLEPFLDSAETFVEFGSGDAALARRVAERVPRVWAVDSSTVASGDLESAAESGRFETVTPEQARSRIPRASVGLAFSCHLIEHLHPDDLPAHLEEVRQLLRPGGRYVVVTPNRLLGPHDVSRGCDRVARGLHLREYDHRELASALRRAGFERVVALVGVGQPPQHSGLLGVGLAEAALALLPRRVRFRLLDALGRPPLRPLEQVKLLAQRE